MNTDGLTLDSGAKPPKYACVDLRSTQAAALRDSVFGHWSLPGLECFIQAHLSVQ